MTGQQAHGREDVEALAESLWMCERAASDWPGNYPKRWDSEPLWQVYHRTAELVLASSWLAQHDARTRAQALREAAENYPWRDAGGRTDVPGGARHWLRARADRIGRGEGAER